MKKKPLLLVALSLLFGTSVATSEQPQANASDYLELDLARQINLVEQTKKLTELIEDLATVPDEVIEILLASDKFNEDGNRIKQALAAFQSARSQELVPDQPHSLGTAKLKIPRLTAGNIAFIEVSRPGLAGRVLFDYEGMSYGGSPGESFNIQKKLYTIVSIQYASAKQINVKIETKSGITTLKYKL